MFTPLYQAKPSRLRCTTLASYNRRDSRVVNIETLTGRGAFGMEENWVMLSEVVVVGSCRAQGFEASGIGQFERPFPQIPSVYLPKIERDLMPEQPMKPSSCGQGTAIHWYYLSNFMKKEDGRIDRFFLAGFSVSTSTMPGVIIERSCLSITSRSYGRVVETK